MKYEVNKVIQFENGEYLILDVINKNNDVYLYLINNDEYKSDVSLVKVNNENNDIMYDYINDEEEFDYVLNQLFVNNEKDILNFVLD